MVYLHTENASITRKLPKHMCEGLYLRMQINVICVRRTPVIRSRTKSIATYDWSVGATATQDEAFQE